jgi:hypothetical protein
MLKGPGREPHELTLVGQCRSRIFAVVSHVPCATSTQWLFAPAEQRRPTRSAQELLRIAAAWIEDP